MIKSQYRLEQSPVLYTVCVCFPRVDSNQVKFPLKSLGPCSNTIRYRLVPTW